MFSISFAKPLWFQLLTTIFSLSILSMETLKLPVYRPEYGNENGNYFLGFPPNSFDPPLVLSRFH